MIVEKMTQYDKLLNELKNYNDELIATVKILEDQNQNLIADKEKTQEDLFKVRDLMTTYEKEFETITHIKDNYDNITSEKNNLEKKNLEILDVNAFLSKKVEDLSNQLTALKSTIENISKDEEHTKIKIKGMLENLSFQLKEKTVSLAEKNNQIDKMLLHNEGMKAELEEKDTDLQRKNDEIIIFTKKFNLDTQGSENFFGESIQRSQIKKNLSEENDFIRLTELLDSNMKIKDNEIS